MTSTSIAITGSSGYLGSAVAQELRRHGRDHTVVPGRLQCLLPQSLDCRVVVHCAGRLRGYPDQRIWTNNVAATAALLRAVPPTASFILASSRAAAAAVSDQYGSSKRQAESLATTHPGAVSIVRLTVLAGPSPRGLGSSFLTRMIRSAVCEGVITIPRRARAVDLLDVREAAAALAGLSEQPQEHQLTVHATSGPLDLSELANLVAQAVLAASGQKVALRRGSVPSGFHPSPESPDQWRRLLSRIGIGRIPLESTIRDTTAIQVSTLEPGHAGC